MEYPRKVKDKVKSASSSQYKKRGEYESKHRYLETLVVVDKKFLDYHKDRDHETYIMTIMNMASYIYIVIFIRFYIYNHFMLIILFCYYMDFHLIYHSLWILILFIIFKMLSLLLFIFHLGC